MTKAEHRDYLRKWRNDNRDCVNERSRRYYKKNSEKFKFCRLMVSRLKFRYPEIYKELA